MNAELVEALRYLEREKDIPEATLLEALGVGLSTAYRKTLGIDSEVRLRVELAGAHKNQLALYRQRQVVEEVEDPETQIALADADGKPLGSIVEEALTDREKERMSRIGAQTAKQVLMQQLREAERNKVFDEFNDKVGDVLTGQISRREGRNILINFGKLEAILPEKEQVPSEAYRIHDRVKVFVVDVRRGNRGPQVIVSRTHPTLIRRLFELEVPEIHDGIVQIQNVAREPGQRSKIAVASKDERVDPVGSCVGQRGQRVQGVVDELRGEKIDIVRWSPDMHQFITESLSPARVLSVQLDEEGKSAFVVVPDNQLSLAIGKSGQNVRLAARLTGWRIDIRSESQVERSTPGAPADEPESGDGADMPTITLADLCDDDE
jgi:N utilization substance protein A